MKKLALFVMIFILFQNDKLFVAARLGSGAGPSGGLEPKKNKNAWLLRKKEILFANDKLLEIFYELGSIRVGTSSEFNGYLFSEGKKLDLKEIKETIEKCADVNLSIHYEGEIVSILTSAVGLHTKTIIPLEIIELLLKKGANVNKTYIVYDGYGLTPLMVASRGGDPALVKLILENGADINVKGIIYDHCDRNDIKLNALIMAVIYNKLEIVRLLLKYGADVNERIDCNVGCENSESLSYFYHGSNALIMAANNNNSDIITILLENGADINAKYDDYSSIKSFIDVINESGNEAAKEAYEQFKKRFPYELRAACTRINLFPPGLAELTTSYLYK